MNNRAEIMINREDGTEIRLVSLYFPYTGITLAGFNNFAFVKSPGEDNWKQVFADSGLFDYVTAPEVVRLNGSFFVSTTQPLKGLGLSLTNKGRDNRLVDNSPYFK